MIADVFLDQKRVNVCENAVKKVPHESIFTLNIRLQSSVPNLFALTLIRHFSLMLMLIIQVIVYSIITIIGIIYSRHATARFNISVF